MLYSINFLPFDLNVLNLPSPLHGIKIYIIPISAKARASQRPPLAELRRTQRSGGKDRRECGWFLQRGRWLAVHVGRHRSSLIDCPARRSQMSYRSACHRRQVIVPRRARARRKSVSGACESAHTLSVGFARSRATGSHRAICHRH